MSNENIFLEEEKIIHEIKLDLAHSITSNFVRITQYDDGISVIRANIFEYYQPVDLTEYSGIVLRLKKPNGNVVVYSSSVDVDKIKINYDSVDINLDINMTDTYGRCAAVLDFLKPDGHVQSTTFILIIERNPVQRGESSTNVPIDAEARLLAVENGKEDKANKVSVLSSTPSENKYPSEKLLFDCVKDLHERINGKTAGVYLYYADNLDAFEYMNLHKIDGTTFATQEELDEYVSGRDCGNFRFNSDDDMIEFVPADMYYIIFCYGSWDDNQRLVVKAEGLSRVVHDKDTVIVVERGVPDRWFNGIVGFGANESKIDLSNVAKTDSYNTFTSSNDFNATQYFNDLDAYSISGRSSDGLIITGGTSDAPLNIDANLLPNTTKYFDLGSADEQWKDLYLSGAAHFGTANFNFSQSGDTTWVFKKGDNKTLMFGEVDDVYVEGTIMPSGNNRDLGSDNQYRKWRNLYLSNAMKIGNTSYSESNLKPMVSITQAEYEALATKDPNTLYLIEE